MIKRLLTILISMFFIVNLAFAHGGIDENVVAQKPISKELVISPDFITKPKFVIELFNGDKITLVRKNIVQHPKQNTTSWIGIVKGFPRSEVFLTVHNNHITGNILYREGRYVIHTKGKRYTITKHDFSEPKHADGIIPDYKPSLFQKEVLPNFTGTVIDVMVMYTNAVETRWGIEGIQAKITNAVDMANQAYINSNIDMRINLVHMERFDYTETGSIGAALIAISGGYYTHPVEALRTQYGADHVVLITSDVDACGVGYQMSNPDVNFAPYAYAAVHDDSAATCLANNSFAHELGHNQGNLHNIENSSGFTGSYDYSYGWRVCTSGGFRTVMSYNCGTPRVSQFSNPDVMYNGVPTGTAGTADTAGANNALSMNNTKDVVASFKSATTPIVPKAPINLTYTANVAGEVTLNWDDKSEYESGFRIERSSDSLNWFDGPPNPIDYSEIATVGSDVDTFTDTGLPSAVQMYYRVRAFNSAGNSVYSNEILVTTLYYETDMNPPVVTVSTPTANQVVGNSFTISGTSTDDVGVVKMRILIDGVIIKTTFTSSISKVYDSTGLTVGNHNVFVKAWDAAGNVSQKKIVVVKQ